MKKLKLFLILGMFALLITPLKAQPPGWPDGPPVGIPTDMNPIPVDVNVYWHTINNTPCEVRFSNWFSIDEFNTFTDEHDLMYQKVEYTLPGNSSGSITTMQLINNWYGNPLPANMQYSIVGAAVWVSLGGSAFIQLLPSGSGSKIHISGATAPCDCFYYYFDFSDPYHPAIRLEPVVAPDTCP